MRKIMYPIIVLILFSCTSRKTSTTSITPTFNYPVTRAGNVSDDYFGTRVADPYRWLEDDRSKETAEWVATQNEITFNYLDKIPFRKALGERYAKIFNFEKFSAPAIEGNYIYYSKNTGLQNQYVIYRERLDGGEPELFLDPNTFSKDGTTSLAGLNFTSDGSMSAYNISEGGSDWQKMIIFDAANKKMTGDTIQDIKFSGASWKGNDGFYYSTYQRPAEGSLLAGVTDRHRLYYHKLGTSQKDDKLIYGEQGQENRYISSNISENQRWLAIYGANSTYGSDLMVLDLNTPGATRQSLVTDKKNQHGILFADDKYFYIQTDRNAKNGKLVMAPVNNPAEANWVTLIDEKPEVVDFSFAGGYIFGNYLKDAVSKVYQYDKSGKIIREIALPGIGTASGFGGKEKDKQLYYTFSGYTTPATIYRYDIESGKSVVYRQPKVQFNPGDYESKQVFYTSKDGTKVPMIITHKKGLTLNGKNPTLLYGYGGFGVSMTPSFRVSNIILLENGGVYAVPNIRGGGEYGVSWHEQGIKTKKQNVFDDFIAAAQYLVDNKYTSKDYLALEGGSNGGLLVGAVITQRPDICKVAFPAVGVLDMLRYHKFTAGAGWAYDYGTSADSKEMFNYLYKYSPLHNIRKASYPATLITTADHDDRVVPAHSFKFASTIQKMQEAANPVLIRVETKAGHGAGMSTKQLIDLQRDKWSFMFYNMGIVPKY
ncbi:MAG: prolyl oligopeptidase family serine peptidase [Ferruginibacter sp.]